MSAFITDASLLAAMTAEWQSSREIWTRLGCWAETAVSQRLNQMAGAETIEKMRQPFRDNGQFRWVYRLKQAR